MTEPASHAILYPALLLVAFTFLTALRMYRSRVREMTARRIDPERLAQRADIARELADTRAADHYANLFEAPVLFYLAVVVIWVAGLIEPFLLITAWAYVLARLVHGAIHLSYNKVMHRFAAFVTSAGILLVLWVRLGWLLVAG